MSPTAGISNPETDGHLAKRTTAARAYGAAAHDLILETAEILFAREGLEAISMEDIARNAKVSRATVFNHFRSKRLLLDEITARSLRNYRDLLGQALDNADTPTPRLLMEMFATMAQRLEANRDLYREVFPEIRKVAMGLDPQGVSPGLRREAVAHLVAIFERGRERGDISTNHPAHALAIAYDSLLSGAVTQWLKEPMAAPLARLLGELLQIFLEGVASSHAAPR